VGSMFEKKLKFSNPKRKHKKEKKKEEERGTGQKGFYARQITTKKRGARTSTNGEKTGAACWQVKIKPS